MPPSPSRSCSPRHSASAPSSPSRCGRSPSSPVTPRAAPRVVRPLPRPALLAPVAALLVLALLPASPPWRLLRASPLRIEPLEGDVSYFAVGRTASVLLIDSSGEWQLRTNGLPESTIQRRGGRLTRQRTAAWLGAL